MAHRVVSYGDQTSLGWRKTRWPTHAYWFKAQA